MMTRRQPLPSAERGTALLAALCFAMVLAVALASYLTVCYRSLQLSTRNMNSTHGTELAELGMEEALWALNKNDWSNSWTFSGTTATKTINSGLTYDNGATGAVTITVTNYNSSTTHTVTATGKITLSDGTTQSRTLSTTSVPAPLFVNAVAGTGATATTGFVKFTAAGTSSNIDSYDSSKGDYTAGVQSPNYIYSAILSSSSTATASATVQLTNAQVKGYVATLSTGPSYSTSATLKGPSTPVTTKVDTSRESTSPYQPIFGIKTPTGTGTTFTNPATNSTTTIGTAGATSPSIYYCSGLNLTGTTTIVVDGPVQLVMTGGSSFYIGLSGGTPQIQITTNGSLEVFSTGDLAIYGNGISNATKDPKKCAIYSSNALTVPDMQTNTDFYGVIYTPYGDFKVWTNNAIYGAIVARNVTFSGSAPVVHYDLNLRNIAFTGIDTPYAVTSVQDTTNP